MLPIIVLSGLIAYWSARREVVAKLAEEGALVAGYQAERIRNSLSFVETTSEYLTKMSVLTEIPKDRERFEELLREALDGNRQLSAIEVRGLPGGETVRFRRVEDGTVVKDAKPLSTNPDLKRSVQEQVQGSWIIPTSNSRATHLYHFQSWTGVQVIMEVAIRRLARPLGELNRGGAYGFLATDSAVIFTDTVPADIPTQKFTDFCANVCSVDRRDAKFYRVTDPLYGEGAWVGTSQVGDLPMVAGVVFLENRAFTPFRELALSLLGTTLTILLFASGAATSASKLLSRPLSDLSSKVSRLGEGSFDNKLEPAPGASREILELTDGFNRMLVDLHSFVEEKELEAAARQAYQSELEVAARIQTSIQPGLPLENASLKATGISRPARQVGGDFLGVFPLEDGSMGFFLGDVSGKGVPAAIYMAFTASLIEYLGRSGWSPLDCLTEVNRALTQRGEDCMFCTCIFGILRADGQMEYCNAGHHSPLCYGSGRVEEIELASGMPLGVIEEVFFETGVWTLEKGSRLLFFTDGVTEAMDEHHQEFGAERLTELLGGLAPSEKACTDLRRIEEKLLEFRGPIPANDDFTLLVLERKPLTRRVRWEEAGRV